MMVTELSHAIEFTTWSEIAWMTQYSYDIARISYHHEISMSFPWNSWRFPRFMMGYLGFTRQQKLILFAAGAVSSLVRRGWSWAGSRGPRKELSGFFFLAGFRFFLGGGVYRLHRIMYLCIYIYIFIYLFIYLYRTSPSNVVWWFPPCFSFRWWFYGCFFLCLCAVSDWFVMVL